MVAVERAPVRSEQLVVLWTWLLEGYVPVAHMVADLDELEASGSNELAGDAPSGRPCAAWARLARRAAA